MELTNHVLPVLGGMHYQHMELESSWPAVVELPYNSYQKG